MVKTGFTFRENEPPTQGVIYCAIDEYSYLESAVISSFALRQVSPQLPIIILTNIKITELQEQLLEFNIVIKLISISHEERQNNVMVSRLIKTSLHNFTEFDKTLYLDADILPVKSIDEIWNFLKFENIAMALDPYPTISQCCHINEAEKIYTLKTCAADSVQFNSGVLLWRNTSDAHTLFNTWQKQWRVFKQQDQLALSRAIQETKVKIAHLPSAYNYPIPLLVNINRIEDIDEINKLKTDLPELNNIKLMHCYKSITLYSQIFQEVAKTLMPDATEKALKCLKSISLAELDIT